MNQTTKFTKNFNSEAKSVPMKVDQTIIITQTICSKTLFAGARELLIDHAGSQYRLRLTNQDKLILTK